MTALYGFCGSTGGTFLLGADDLNANDPANPRRKVTVVGDRFLIGVTGNDCPDLVLSAMSTCGQKFDFSDMQSLANYLAKETRKFAKELFPMFYMNLMEEKNAGKQVSFAEAFADLSTLIVIDKSTKKMAEFKLGKPYCMKGYIPVPYCRYLAPDHIHFFEYAVNVEPGFYRKWTEEEAKDPIQFFKAHVTRVAQLHPDKVGKPGSFYFEKEGVPLVSENLKMATGTLAQENFDILAFFQASSKIEGEAKASPPTTEFWDEIEP